MIAVFDTNTVIDALNGIADSDAEYLRYERVLISHIYLDGSDGGRAR